MEWRFTDDDNLPAITAKTPRSTRHWQPIAVAAMIVLGLGLGWLYHSIPEPPPRPAPVPTPTIPHFVPTLDPSASENFTFKLLEQTIDREARALAAGDLTAFMDVQDTSDRTWMQEQRDNFSPWGTSPDASDRAARLYFFFGLTPQSLARHQAWIDIRQVRDNSYFRETRFYQLRDNRWVRTRPDTAFWSGARRTLESQHFTLSVPIEDEAFASAMLDRFEIVYGQLCRDLNCTVDADAPEFKVNLIVRPELDRASWLDLGQAITISLPSPRVTGWLDSSADIDWHDPITGIAYARLLDVVARLGSGGTERWAASQDGLLYLNSVIQWKYSQVIGRTNPDDLIRPDLLQGRKITLPKYLWDWPIRDSRRLNAPQAQANSVIVYIDRSFGAPHVLKFLKAIGSANSLPHAIEASLPIAYDDFERLWLEWIGQRLRP